MAKTNVASASAAATIYTHEGAVAQRTSPLEQLRRAALTCLLFEDTFYESGESIAKRISELVPKVEPRKVVELAIEARNQMHLRHVPLFLLRELARRKGNGSLVQDGLCAVIQRADEMGEFLSLYWKDGRQPVSAGVKRALRHAFTRFDAYQLGKYNRDSVVKLRDVMFLVHPKPKDDEQADTWKRLVSGDLASPDTWEAALSSGKDKRETFERLLREKRLGGLAFLRNLRNMFLAGVDDDLIRERFRDGLGRILPFQYVTAAKHAPKFEPDIERAMLASLFASIPEGYEGSDSLPGKTGLLVDVSVSMGNPLSNKGQATRLDAACGLAIYLREKAEYCEVATFSSGLTEIPPRRGFALRDAIVKSQPHMYTNLREALDALRPKWNRLDRTIVITDEQSHDGIATAFTPKAWVINVAPYKPGLGYGNGWQHINGWSERVVDFIRLAEQA